MALHFNAFPLILLSLIQLHSKQSYLLEVLSVLSVLKCDVRSSSTEEIFQKDEFCIPQQLP